MKPVERIWDEWNIDGETGGEWLVQVNKNLLVCDGCIKKYRMAYTSKRGSGKCMACGTVASCNVVEKTDFNGVESILWDILNRMEAGS